LANKISLKLFEDETLVCGCKSRATDPMDFIFGNNLWKERNRSDFLARTGANEKRPMAAAPYFFQILLPGWNDGTSDAIHRAVVVEVIPAMVLGAGASGDREKTEREVAEREARRAAAEITKGEFESASEPANAIAQIGALPEEIGERPPAVQRAGVRAWLL
jgi:hypothetical protein